jgi:hypothetical protein
MGEARYKGCGAKIKDGRTPHGENEKQKNAAGKRGTEKTAKEKIQWHPGFVAATELEFRKNRDDLDFNPEYSLSKRPLAIDILIKKKRDVAIENEIGRIFRVHNVLEYKSPEASLNIDNYYKTVAYACLYKALGEHVNDIKADEVTVSIFREMCPKGLLAELAGSGAVLEVSAAAYLDEYRKQD